MLRVHYLSIIAAIKVVLYVVVHYTPLCAGHISNEVLLCYILPQLSAIEPCHTVKVIRQHCVERLVHTTAESSSKLPLKKTLDNRWSTVKTHISMMLVLASTAVVKTMQLCSLASVRLINYNRSAIQRCMHCY
jgi:hypothetical protein